MLKKKLLSTVLSIFISPLFAYISFMYFEEYSGVVRIGALVLAGIAAGIAQGALFGERFYMTIGVGALLGALVMWAPIVMVTYGFALLGLPVLMAYAACVGVGAKFSGRFFPSVAPSST